VIDFSAKRVLTFDCYGTLIDWERGILASFRSILAAHGTVAGDEDLLTIYGELESTAERGAYRPYRDVLVSVSHQLGERLGLRVSQAEAARFADSVGDWPVFPDTPVALSALKGRFRLAIISNVDDDLFARTHEKLGTAFDWVVTAEQVRSYKPSLNNFRQALARIGLPREHVLHVAQSLFHDHGPAKQLGLETVWVNRRHGRPGTGATPAATVLADLEVPDLATLARLAGAM